MNKRKLDKFKNILNKKLQDLIVESHQTLGGMTETKENYADITDLAAFESDQNFMLRIGERNRKLINKIRGVLDKVDDGTFGFCERCGEPIPEERLEARPETTHCIECKTDMEDQERRLRAE